MSDERIAKLMEFLAREPNDSFTRYALALEHAGRGKTELAVSMLNELLQRDPKYIPAYQQLGYAYQKLERHDDAKEIFKRGIRVATEQGDLHARSEMQAALDELEM
ncbi:MAG: tetratricopeptide repeat protein [Bacteroidota bacterium]